MRRQTLFLSPVLLGGIIVSSFLALRSQRTRAVLATPAAWRREEAQGLTLDLPVDASKPLLNPGDPWTATEFRSLLLGHLRIARERPRRDLQGAFRDWFELPGPLDGPVTYSLGGQPAQARPVMAFGPSAYCVRRQGRMLVAVCVFDLGGYRYWVQTRERDASRDTLACFSRVLGSMRDGDGAGVDGSLKSDLEAAEMGLAPGIAQNLTWVAVVPAGMMLLGLGLAFSIGRWSGRPPREAPAGASYLASGLEVCLGSLLQRKYFDASLAILGDRLVLYTFGTPFLNVPLDRIKGHVSEGTAWFGPPYLEVVLEGSLDYLKNRFLGRLWSGRTRLRIYTEEAGRLRTALGA